MLSHNLRRVSVSDSRYIGSVTAVYSSGSTLTVSLTSLGVTTGDIVILALSSDTLGFGAISPTFTSLVTNGTPFTDQYVLYRVLTSGNTSVTFSGGTLTNASVAVVCSVFRGVSFRASQTTNTTTTGDPTFPSISVNTYELLVVAAAIDDNDYTATAPPGFILAAAVGSTRSSSLSSAMIAYKKVLGTGTESSGAFGNRPGSNSEPFVSASIALS